MNDSSSDPSSDTRTISSSGNRVTTVLQITDCHLLSETGKRLLGVDTEDSLRAVLSQAVSEVTPDVLLVTGDIAHDPSLDTYSRFTALVREYFSGPMLCIPGNHDLWTPMRSLLSEPSRMDLGGWRLIGMDTHVDDDVAAHLRASDEELLREACATADGTHLLIACHHPPISLECSWIDKHRIPDGDALLGWLSEHTCVKGMVFGHAHQTVDASFKHITLMGTPSSCFQFAPHTERFTIDTAMPGYRWLYLADDGSIRTDVRRVEDYPLHIDLSQRA
ncbi:MAG: metallophosphoesterase [Gammaproteobacteria bacterium]|nr:metallophosphoesterase [Gammaproteobacteria bacterium]